MAGFISQRGKSVGTNGDDGEPLEVQQATHQDILKFGNLIYERKCAELEKLREESLVDLEEKIWTLANEDKENAVKETFENGQVELQKVRESAKKEKDKAVKTECKRVEAYMKKQASQQLQKVEEAFAVQLKEALHDVRIEFEVEKMLAVRQTKEDEINHTIEELAKAADLEEQKRKKIILEAEKEKAEALKKLKSRMEKECEVAVDEAKEICRQISLEEIRKCEERHLLELEEVKQEIVKRDENYAAMKVQVSEKAIILRRTETKLLEVVQEFQEFINLTKGFSNGQSEYLLPDINLIQDKLKETVLACEK